MMVSLLLPIPFLLFSLAFNKFGLGRPKGFALFISAEAGLEMIYLIFMVYLYHRFFFGSFLFKLTCSFLAMIWFCSRIK